MSDKLIASYTNGGCHVSIFESGTKVRKVLSDVPPVLPEQMDLKITDWCDAGCAWCHEGSTLEGTHGDLNKALKLLEPLPAGAEIAIGGGDPLSHPDFEYFVSTLASRGIVPSVTVNGKHFERHREMLTKLTSAGKLFGVGFSYHREIPDWDYEHLVLHFIAGVHDPEILLADGVSSKKILILGYKQFGRGKDLFSIRPEKVNDMITKWYRLLPFLAQKHHLSFDNLAIEQLNPKRLFADKAKFEQQYMGPEGQYSMYVDAVKEEYALSSYSPGRTGWSKLSAMFADVRKSQGFVSAC